MSRFIQLHLLTSYPPSNLNRDDLGRPKSAIMGGVPRLRVSSQSLKRAWRMSEVFEKAVHGQRGTRTKAKGVEIYQALITKGVEETQAHTWAKQIAEKFGKAKKVKEKKDADAKTTKAPADLEIEQLAHFSPQECEAIEQLTHTLAKENRAPTDDELKNLLTAKHKSPDIALFGRMLASSPDKNMEAACQVAHAITVHKVQVEDDFFTAVDDLNNGQDDLGAGHMGETEFGAGVFYLYICLDKTLLSKNLQHDETLVKQTLQGLLQAATTIAPTGKQNSFASRARASYALAEKGDQQPRSLAVAYLNPIYGQTLLATAIAELKTNRDNMNAVYGDCADATQEFNVLTGEGSLDNLLTFIAE